MIASCEWDFVLLPKFVAHLALESEESRSPRPSQKRKEKKSGSGSGRFVFVLALGLLWMGRPRLKATDTIIY